jgi:hypothetical protein
MGKRNTFRFEEERSAAQRSAMCLRIKMPE